MRNGPDEPDTVLKATRVAPAGQNEIERGRSDATQSRWTGRSEREASLLASHQDCPAASQPDDWFRRRRRAGPSSRRVDRDALRLGSRRGLSRGPRRTREERERQQGPKCCPTHPMIGEPSGVPPITMVM